MAADGAASAAEATTRREERARLVERTRCI
jgi:hypothetical protein